MSRRRFGIAVAGTGLVVAAYIALLLTGGTSDERSSFEDFPDDVAVPEGAEASDAAVPDVTFTAVRGSRDEVAFEARLDDAPRRPSGGSLELRWELSGAGRNWSVSAVLDRGLEASVDPEGSASLFTSTGTLPGDVSLQGRTVSVRIDASRIRGWPETFSWHLTSRFDPEGPDVVLDDRAPDAGSGLFPARPTP